MYVWYSACMTAVYQIDATPAAVYLQGLQSRLNPAMASTMPQRKHGRKRKESVHKWVRKGAHADEVDGIRHGRYTVRWQVYLSEWDVWKAYTPRQSSRIEAAWQAHAAQVDIVSDEDDYVYWSLCLVSLLQTNIKSDTRRPIQRTLVTHR